MELILFYLIAGIALLSAGYFVFAKNPLYAILSLIVTFFSIAGMYILLNAQFLGVIQVIVYAGAIMVLFLFVVMLMNLNSASEPARNYRLHIIGIVSGGSLLLILLSALMKGNHAQMVEMKIGDQGLIGNLGKILFTNYVLPFEIASVLFLSAMIGAVIIGKKN